MLFFASAAKGIEKLLEIELRLLGVRTLKVSRAGVEFEGSLEDAYRVCLWSRLANRVLLPLKTIDAPTPEKLYGGVKSIRWSDHLTASETIAVDFTSTRSEITHTHFGAQKTKDAICDQLKSVQGARPSVDTSHPDIRVNVYLFEDRATISLDLSGESLHRRGYRAEGEHGVEAPLKENLGSAIVLSSDWPRMVEAAYKGNPDFSRIAFVDGMCGSGTLVLEAALYACDIAPGISGVWNYGSDQKAAKAIETAVNEQLTDTGPLRGATSGALFLKKKTPVVSELTGRQRHWGFSRWRQHDEHSQRQWKLLCEDAYKRAHAGVKWAEEHCLFQASDRDYRAIVATRENAERVGLKDLFHIEKVDFENIAVPSKAKAGVVALNPPYGERLGHDEDLSPLYEQIGDVFKKKFATSGAQWSGFVFTGSPDGAKSIGLRSSRKIPLYNGAIECRLFRYELYEGSRESRAAVGE